MKKVWTLTLLLWYCACHFPKENGVNIRIKNDSDLPITNLKFYTSEKLDSVRFNKIEARKSRTGFLSMKNNKTDGSYVLELTRDDETNDSYSGGYYTNGGSLENKVIIEVKQDTAIFEFSGVPY